MPESTIAIEMTPREAEIARLAIASLLRSGLGSPGEDEYDALLVESAVIDNRIFKALEALEAGQE